jgi:hypothetical protein
MERNWALQPKQGFIMLPFNEAEMMKLFLLLMFIQLADVSFAQELYVFTNPASNIPAKSVVTKLSGKSMISYHNNEREYRFSPEVQLGVTKKLMLAGGASFSNMFFQDAVAFESARLYAKYRFYSKDEMYKHFRAAVFATGSWSNNALVYQEFNLDGDNSGVQVGVVATQLIHKFAASTGVSFVNQLEQTNKLSFGPPFSNQAIQYNLSMGYLLFPFNYKTYNQTNLNLYCEFLGQQNTDLKRGFVDMAPSLQLIVKSRTRFNLGARFQLAGTAHRMAKQSLFVSIEHYFLNALK